MLAAVGPGSRTDAWVAALAVPQLLVAVAADASAGALVPLLAARDGADRDRPAWAFALLAGVASGALAALLAASAGSWVRLLVPGFGSEARELTARLVRIALPGMVLAVLAAVLAAVGRARRRHARVEAASPLSSAIGLAVLAVGLPRHGIVAAAWAYVVRMAVRTALLAPLLGPWRGLGGSRPALAEAWRRIRPLAAGSFFFKTDLLVDRLLSSMSAAGALTLLSLAQQIYGAAAQILSRSLVAPLAPELAELATSGDAAEFGRRYRSRARWMAGASAAAALVAVAGAGFAPGRFAALSPILALLAGVLVFGGLGEVTASAFFARGDTRTPTRIGAAVYAACLPVKVGAYFAFGVPGLAATASLALGLAFALGWRALASRTGPADPRP